jgi:type IV secretory pathway VirD2 relaxase
VADRVVGRPLFDVASHARRGPGRRDRLTAAEIEQVRRTVGRTPEVMVKVLTRGAVTPGQVRQHADYIGRKGDLALETDDGQRLIGQDAGSRLVEDWDLDLPVAGSAERVARGGGRDARLVHKLIFSMPAGTPPEKVLGAVRDFAREEFGLTHRYAMALHTDEPHPHVHLLVKAASEQGERLNIRKETLRRWRAGFAEQLRARGVAANATERAVRGQSKQALKDGIYRAAGRGESTHLRERLRTAADAIAKGTRMPADAGAWRLHDTSEQIWAGYLAIAAQLLAQGDRNLSGHVRAFADRIQYPATHQERDRERVRELLRLQERAREVDLTR